MKKLLIAMSILCTLPVCAAEETLLTQKVVNENSLGINFEKQPAQEGGKQHISNKKSFLFINVVINGKCSTDNSTTKNK